MHTYKARVFAYTYFFIFYMAMEKAEVAHIIKTSIDTTCVEICTGKLTIKIFYKYIPTYINTIQFFIFKNSKEILHDNPCYIFDLNYWRLLLGEKFLILTLWMLWVILLIHLNRCLYSGMMYVFKTRILLDLCNEMCHVNKI